jgi:hypothetical protein
MDDEQMQEKLDYVVNHVFMPPRLPQRDEQEDYFDKDHYLCRVALESCRQFVGSLPRQQHLEGKIALRAMELYVEFNGPTPFDATDLSESLAQMKIGGASPTACIFRRRL